MRIAIDIGHNCRPDTGAVGILNECRANKVIGELLIKKLKAAGVEVVNVTPKSTRTVRHSLIQRVSAANNSRCDYYISLHHNAFNGKAHGVETYALSDAGRALASPIQSELSGLGFFDRGVKFKRFYVLRATTMPAILIEVCFVDSHRDAQLWNSLGAEKIASAIFAGIRRALKI